MQLQERCFVGVTTAFGKAYVAATNKTQRIKRELSRHMHMRLFASKKCAQIAPVRREARALARLLVRAAHASSSARQCAADVIATKVQHYQLHQSKELDKTFWNRFCVLRCGRMHAHTTRGFRCVVRTQPSPLSSSLSLSSLSFLRKCEDKSKSAH